MHIHKHITRIESKNSILYYLRIRLCLSTVENSAIVPHGIFGYTWNSSRSVAGYIGYIRIKSTAKSRIMSSHDRRGVKALRLRRCRCCWSLCTVAMIFSGRSITVMSNVTSRSGAAISSANHRDRALAVSVRSSVYSVDSARISSYPLPLSLLPEHLLNVHRRVHHRGLSYRASFDDDEPLLGVNSFITDFSFRVRWHMPVGYVFIFIMSAASNVTCIYVYIYSSRLYILFLLWNKTAVRTLFIYLFFMKYRHFACGVLFWKLSNVEVTHEVVSYIVALSLSLSLSSSCCILKYFFFYFWYPLEIKNILSMYFFIYASFN